MASLSKRRLIAEKKALDEKIEKLGSFLQSDQFNKMCMAATYGHGDKKSNDHVRLLPNQMGVMRQYSDILNARIKACQ